jgi:hypothetical protein
MMLSNETFVKQFLLMSENFGFAFTTEYQLMIYAGLKNLVNDQEFVKISHSIIKDTKLTDWNAAYGFKGKPALADWIEAYAPPKKKWKSDESTGFKVIEDISNNLRLK